MLHKKIVLRDHIHLLGTLRRWNLIVKISCSPGARQHFSYAGCQSRTKWSGTGGWVGGRVGEWEGGWVDMGDGGSDEWVAAKPEPSDPESEDGGWCGMGLGGGGVGGGVLCGVWGGGGGGREFLFCLEEVDLAWWK